MKSGRKIFWGLFFIAAAAFIIIGKLGFLEELSVFTLVLTVFLAAIFTESIIHLCYSGMFFPIAVLCILYDEYLGIEALTPWPVLGAALLLTIGCTVLFGHKGWKKYGWGMPWHSGRDVQSNTENTVKFEKSFGDCVYYVNSDNFEYGNFECSFGSMKVYFDNAVIQNGKAAVHAEASFGNMELYIPRGWNIVNNAESAFGSVEEKNRNESTGTPTLIITGSANFGKLTIIYI